MKRIALAAVLILTGSQAWAAGAGCQNTSGPLTLEKVRAGASGTEMFGCINRSLDAISSSTVVGSSATYEARFVAVGVSTAGLKTDSMAAGVSSAALRVELVAVGVATQAHASLTGADAHGAASANTASQIVARDGSGNFSAGAITAALTGNVTGNVSGSAGTATALAADPAGCAAGSVTFDISAAGVSSCAAVFDSMVNGSTAPVTSNQLYGHNALTAAGTHGSASANTINTLVHRDGSGNFSAGTITSSLTGASSLNVLKAGDTMTGSLTISGAGVSAATGTFGGGICPSTASVCFNALPLSANAGAYFGGNVGVGTTAPSAKLDVNGVLTVTTASIRGEPIAYFGDSIGGGTPGMSMKVLSIGTAAGDYPVNSAAYNAILNVGTQNVSPYKSLHLRGGAILAGNLGNVGIGNTAPTTKLDVTGTAVASHFFSSGTLTAPTIIGPVTVSLSSLTIVDGGGTRGLMLLGSAPGMQYTETDNSGSFTHQVVDGVMSIGVCGTEGCGNTIAIWKQAEGISASVSTITFTAARAEFSGSIQQETAKDCTLGATTDAAGKFDGCVASSIKLKQGVSALPYDPARIDDLRPVLYRMKDSPTIQRSGFIAEEVASVMPSASVPAGKLTGVDPNAIASALVQEVQMLRKRMLAAEKGSRELAARVAALEAKVKAKAQVAKP